MADKNEAPYHALGLRVAAYRARMKRENGKGWTQSDLAVRLNTSPIRVSKIERGLERPTVEQALWLSENAGIAAKHWDRVERELVASQ